MGAHRQIAEAGKGLAPGFHVHVESGRARGSLTTVLVVPAEPPAALAAALASLHDPAGSLDLDTRLGHLASDAPEGTAFLVGLGDHVWVLPSAEIRLRRIRDGEAQPLEEPQVVSVRPGDRIEVFGPAGDEPLARLSLAPKRSGLPRARGRPRLPSARVAVPAAVILLAGIAGGVALQNRSPSAPEPRADAYTPPPALEDRVVELLTRGASSSAARPDPGTTAPEAVEEFVAVGGEVGDEPAATSAAEAAADPWSFRAGGAITSSPLVIDGRVLFGSRDSTLYCLDARTGEVRWRFAAGAGIGSSPGAADGLCLFGTYAGELVACDLDTGEVRWRARTGGKIVSSPCVAGGRVVVGSYDRSVHAFDPGTGEKIWSVPTGSRVRASAEPVGADAIAIGSADGSLYCLALSDGTLRWRRRTPAAILATAAYDAERHRVIVGSQDGTTLCLDAGTGEVRWRASVGAEVNAQPRLTERTVLVGNGKGALHALDRETGEVRWNARAGRGFDARPLVRGETVVAPSFDGVIHVLALGDGAVREERSLGSEVFASPAAAGDLVYVGTLGGTLHALPLP